MIIEIILKEIIDCLIVKEILMEVMYMRFIVFWEYLPETLDEVLKKLNKFEKEEAKNKEKYPTILTGPFLFTGESKGITICSADNDEQIFSLYQYLHPELKMSFVPVMDTKEAKEFLLPGK